MIFSNKSVESILSGKKSQTRRLVKKNEKYSFIINSNKKINSVYTINKVFGKKTKWVVGKDYAVQLGRGKKGLWYCLECKKEIRIEHIGTTGVQGKVFVYSCYCMEQSCLNKDFCKPLRVKIIGIRKEKLSNITNEDAIKEGYINREDFVIAFCNINNLNIKKVFYEKINHFVWVLDIKIKEECELKNE